MAKKEETIEKAVSRQVGDTHPNGKWVWTEYKPGKFDWRPIKGKKAQQSGDGSSSGGEDDGATKKTPSKPSASQIAGAKAKAGKPMNSQQLLVWAQKTSDDNLLKVANSKNGNAQMRKIAYDALEQRGFDMSQVDTSGTLAQLMKMTGKKGAAATSDDDDEDTVATAAEGADVDIDGNEEEDGDPSKPGFQITEKWYLDKNDDRVKKAFNLKTKEGRIKYDQFVYKMKKKEKDYKNPVEVVQDLNEQYLEFLDNDEQRFMISAGGAGIGKSYGFNKMAELLNMKPFEEGDSPGDGDYDIFEAPDVNSGKQLLNILKAHNGKIIVFDDNDKVLKRADCASVMKKATATTGRRVVGDPDDVKQNFEFTGRIIIMTNKDLAALSESEDTKAIISRAMMVSEIYMTVPETIEVMESRYQDYEFPSAPRLDDEAADKKERDEIMNLIKKNQKNIDPSQFTTRTFQEILTNKRKVDKANEKRANPAFAALIGSKNKDWKEVALGVLTKAAMNDFGGVEPSDELLKAEETLFEKGECPEDDGVDYTVDEPEEEEIDDVEKAEEVLFDEDDTDIFKADFSEKERKKLAKKKEALPDGSFPIRNTSDLKNAIQAIGRAKDPDKAKAWIKKRAKALGKEDLLPDTWKAEDVLNFGEEDMDLQKAETILFGK
jgi:hypothetical protein|nr:MAG TPA: Bacterial TniB protein [Caudoviricetes sp.]